MGLRREVVDTPSATVLVRLCANHTAGSDIFQLNAAQRIYFVIKVLRSQLAGIGWLGQGDRARCSLNAAPNIPAKQTRDFTSNDCLIITAAVFPKGTAPTASSIAFKTTLFQSFSFAA